MSSPTPTINPIQNSKQWHFFMLSGFASPGTIPRGGVKGFRRATGWDKLAGKGTKGATLILKTVPPIEGTFTIQLFTPADFQDWDSFVENVLSINPAAQKAEGLSIYYPAFSSLGFTQCVIDDYSPPEHIGKGLYNVEIKLIEWQKPPPKSIVSTVANSAPDTPDTTVPLDPRIQDAQDEVADALLDQSTSP